MTCENEEEPIPTSRTPARARRFRASPSDPKSREERRRTRASTARRRSAPRDVTCRASLRCTPGIPKPPRQARARKPGNDGRVVSSSFGGRNLSFYRAISGPLHPEMVHVRTPTCSPGTLFSRVGLNRRRVRSNRRIVFAPAPGVTGGRIHASRVAGNRRTPPSDVCPLPCLPRGPPRIRRQTPPAPPPSRRAVRREAVRCHVSRDR